MDRKEMEKLHTKILKYLGPHHHHVHQNSVKKDKNYGVRITPCVQVKNNVHIEQLNIGTGFVQPQIKIQGLFKDKFKFFKD